MVARFEWKSVSYEPGNIDVPILAWTKHNKLMVFKDTKSYIYGDPNPYSNWKWLVEKYNIKFGHINQKLLMNIHMIMGINFNFIII